MTAMAANLTAFNDLTDDNIIAMTNFDFQCFIDLPCHINKHGLVQDSISSAICGISQRH